MNTIPTMDSQIYGTGTGSIFGDMITNTNVASTYYTASTLNTK